MSIWARIALAGVVTVSLNTVAQAKVSAAEAAKLGKELMPLGGEKAGNADGSIPAWDGGMVGFKPADADLRRFEAYAKYGGTDKPLYTIDPSNASKYADKLSAGHLELLKKYPSYRIPVYPSRRNVYAPEFVYAATKKNALEAELANEGESLLNAVTGIPFPIPKSGKEIMWNHKTRYRGLGVTRFNVQLAVQTNGSFTPYVLREDVQFAFSKEGINSDALENVMIYFLQVTTAPPRQSGNVLLIHETIDQVKEPRRAWLYNPGQRRTRRAPNVAYDNPGTGADGLRTNDQLDVFNGATDRYSWKIVGKREMIVPYNSIRLADDRLKYTDIVKEGHLDPQYTRYEMHRVWVVDSEVKEGTSHIYKRRTFYVDEDSWTILAADIYDKRDTLWRLQEYHPIVVPPLQGIGPACDTVYDLQSGRYLAMEMSNEEAAPTAMDFTLDHFRTSNLKKVAQQLR